MTLVMSTYILKSYLCPKSKAGLLTYFYTIY